MCRIAKMGEAPVIVFVNQPFCDATGYASVLFAVEVGSAFQSLILASAHVLVQHELLGFPIEKVSFPDYKTKSALMPHFFTTYSPPSSSLKVASSSTLHSFSSPPPLSVHVPGRPLCVPKQGPFRQVLCRHQVLYNRQSKV